MRRAGAARVSAAQMKLKGENGLILRCTPRALSCTPVNAFRSPIVLHYLSPSKTAGLLPYVRHAISNQQRLWIRSIRDCSVCDFRCCCRRSPACLRVLLCWWRVHHDLFWVTLPEPDVRGEVDPRDCVSEVSHYFSAWRRVDWYRK